MARPFLKNALATAVASLLLLPRIALEATAKISDFVLLHSEAVIKASSSYAKLSKLSDADLKKTVLTPDGSGGGDFIESLPAHAYS